MGFFSKSKIGQAFNKKDKPENKNDVEDYMSSNSVKKSKFSNDELAGDAYSKFTSQDKYKGLSKKDKKELYKEHLSNQESVAKAAIVKRVTLQEQAKMLAYKQKMEQAKKYGPGTFYIAGQEIPVVGQINQYRNWQQEQDIKNQKAKIQIEYDRQRLAALRAQSQPQNMSMGGGMSMGPSQSSYNEPQSNPYGGMSLGPTGGGFGGGRSMGPSMGPQQPQLDQFGQPIQRRDPMSMSMPIIGGLGGGWGMGSQQEQQPVQQYAPQAQPQQQYVQPAQAQRPQYVPQQRTYPNYPKPVTGVLPKRPSYVPEPEYPNSIYRKTITSYGPSFKKIDESEVQPGEKVYRRVQMPYGHKFLLIK
jgi:Mor family transcriptional regulator